MSEKEYATFPDQIFVRHLKYKVEPQGFRTHETTLAAKLIDANVYEAEELAMRYYRRWNVELHIRELKRRKKNYKLMTSPRNPNRNRYETAA